MDLKQLLIPKKIETDEKLYYHKSEDLVENVDGTLRFHQGGIVDFTTYFNSFSTGKWSKYTVVEKVQAALMLQGAFKVTLLYHVMKDKGAVTETLAETSVKCEKETKFLFDFGTNRKAGIFSIKCEALQPDSSIYKGVYLQENLLPANLNVNLLIDICTFKREEYVYRNLELLKKGILENPDSPLYRHMYVHISDNAKTLDSKMADGNLVKISPNRNVGGVGGFTRGIIEALSLQKSRDISHVLLMDDDAMIEPACLETTYTFLSLLKEEYKDYTLGGSIMQLDKPWRQFEEGAQWNRGNIIALKHKIDMRDLENLLINEEETEKVEYTGWWYACIPLSVIDKNNLPLPIFIHRDDVEYGLRVGKGFIYMNGICVWHEAFENKVPGPLEYYDIRNLAIVNAIHYPEYGKKQFKKLLIKWVSSNAARYRYRYVDLNLRAVEDFCKGIDWFLKQEAEPLHREIACLNYKADSKEKYIGYKGITEADYDWEMLLTPKEDDIIPTWKKILHMITINGYLLPVKKNKVLVVPPYNNIYKMYRSSEVIFVDAVGNSVSTKRSLKQLVGCYTKLFKTLRLIDKKYDKAKESYHAGYQQMISMEFWKKYLEM